MKRVLLYVLVSVLGTFTMVSQVDIDQQLKENILRDAQRKNRSITEIREVIKYDFLEHIYVVQLEPTGWCLVAPQAPDNYRIASNYFHDWSIDLNDPNQISWYKLFDHPSEPKQSSRLKSDTDQNVEPLIKTSWSQYCMPDDKWGNNATPVSGCVATAMAQVIRYFEFPAHGYGTIINQHWYGEGEDAIYAEADLTNDYNYAVMPNNTGCNDAKAELLYECGVLAQAYYGVTETGANTLTGITNMSKYLNYSSAHYTGLLASGNRHEKVMEHLSNNIPIIVAGSRDNTENSPGHAFILDGYDKEQGYHFNLGWGGYSNAYYEGDDIPYKTNMVLYYGVVPSSVGEVDTYPYKSDLYSLADWDHTNNLEIGMDEVSNDGYVLMDESTDHMELVYKVPTDQKDMSLIIDLEVIRNSDLPQGSSTSLEITASDYFDGKIEDIKLAHFNTNNNPFKTKRFEYKLDELKGHTLKIKLDCWTGDSRPHKYSIKNVEVKRMCNEKLTDAVCKSDHIDVIFSSEVKKGDYNPAMFHINHGSFNYPATKVEAFNTNKVRIYSDYTIKEKDVVKVSYVPNNEKGYLVDMEELLYNRPYYHKQVTNESNVSNVPPVWKAIENDDPNAFYKLKFEDPDNDMIEVSFMENEKLEIKDAGNNTYYVYSDLSSIGEEFLIPKVKDFSLEYYLFIQFKNVVVTNVDDQVLNVLKLFPNPASNSVQLNENCELVHFYELSGQLVKMVTGYS
ncbi:MAG: C10 family peptidase, partial [Carboxylicivirga sp.]|nr:C10 family peptidase [Carboxylicivirga sp.]